MIDALHTISGPNWADDWAKVTTPEFSTPHADAVIHFYKNTRTGTTWYGKGLKLIFQHGF